MDREYRLSLDDGKYTFVKPVGDYRVYILRHGEPWVTIEAGCNAVFSLLYECLKLKGELKDG